MSTSKSWGHLVEFLLGQTLRIPPGKDAWQGCKPKRLALDPVREWLLAAEYPCRADIEAAIDEWIETRQWPDGLSGSVQGHLRLRLMTVAGFLAGLCLCGAHNETSLVPFPDDQVEMARWMLTDWWDQHGRSEASRLWILDQLDRRAYVPAKS